MGRFFNKYRMGMIEFDIKHKMREMKHTMRDTRTETTAKISKVHTNVVSSTPVRVVRVTTRRVVPIHMTPYHASQAAADKVKSWFGK